MNPLSFTILASLVSIVLFAPRRWAILGMAAGVLYLTQRASVDVAGFNLYSMRFLEVAGFIRIIARREYSFSNWKDIDNLFLVFYGYVTLVFLLRSNSDQAYQIGAAVDAFLCYFTFRAFIKDADDFLWFLRKLTFLLIPYVGLLLIEMLTQQNPFSILGGTIVEIYREGRVRCMGSFRNYSLLGTLGATFMPLYIALAMRKEDRKPGVIGCVLCLMIIFLSNSGGPIAAMTVGVIGWLLYPIRTRMRIFRRGLVAMLMLLAVVMKAPIWYLPAKVSSITGGDGWHRSYLLEMATRDFGKWWLWGMPYANTSSWFPYQLPGMGMADITNQFLAFGLTGGLIAMILFILLLVRCYRNLGNALTVVQTCFPLPIERELLLWGLGVMLAVHISNWFGVTYFDQTYVIWFMQLATIVSVSQACMVLHTSWIIEPAFQHATLQQLDTH